MEPVKILIVDDNPANLLALEAVLGQPPYALVRATSGFEALELARAQEFAAAILDIRMPGLDGYETAVRMKTLPAAKDLPIIFMTAHYKADEEVRRGYEVGAVDYLGKPFDPEVLRRKIRIYADLYVERRQAAEREALRQQVSALRWKGQALDIALGMVEEGVTIVGREGTILAMNPVARRIWSGRAPALEAVAGDYQHWLADQGGGIESGAEELARALEVGAVLENAPTEIRRFDHERILVHNSIAPLRDDRGALLGAVWVTRQDGARRNDPADVDGRPAA